jgi:hypothetical protein
MFHPYAVADLVRREYIIPSIGFTPVFNDTMSRFLLCVKKLSNGRYLVSGSSLVLEAMRTEQTERGGCYIPLPNDMDVYIALPRCFDNLMIYPKEVEGYVRQAFNKLRKIMKDAGLRVVQRDIRDFPFRTNRQSDRPYNQTFGGRMAMVAIIEFHLMDYRSDHTYIHPVKIQLMVMHYVALPTFLCYRKRGNWVDDILDSYDINVCKGMLDIDTRRISYPISDEYTFFFVRARKFYYELRSNNRDAGQRILKYTRRGFEHVAYFDRTGDEEEILHILADNTIVHDEWVYPHQELLPPGTIPDESFDYSWSSASVDSSRGGRSYLSMSSGSTYAPESSISDDSLGRPFVDTSRAEVQGLLRLAASSDSSTTEEGYIRFCDMMSSSTSEDDDNDSDSPGDGQRADSGRVLRSSVQIDDPEDSYDYSDTPDVNLDTWFVSISDGEASDIEHLA